MRPTLAFGLWSAVLLLLSAVVAPAAPVAVTADAKVQLAVSTFQNGQHDEALNVLAEVVKVAPSHAYAHFLIGAVLQAQGNTEQALRQYVRSLSLDPAQYSAHYNTGIIHRHGRRPQQARHAFLEALALRPDCALALNNIGLSFHFEENFTAASLWFQRAVSVASAAILEGASDASSASHRYRQNATLAEAYFNLGVSFARQGHVLRAAQAYKSAVASAQDLNVPAHDIWVSAAMNLAALFHHALQLEEALAWYNRALSRGVPLGAAVSGDLRRDLYKNVGTVLLQLGRVPAAIDAYMRGTPSVPHPDAPVPAEIRSKANATPELLARTSLAADLWRARNTICDWERYDERRLRLQLLVRAVELDNSLAPSLLPFDTLLADFDEAFQRHVASAFARPFSRRNRTRSSMQPPTKADRQRETHPFRISYFSHDFNDHPTAQLMEGLFAHHDRDNVAVSIVSYGKDDSSRLRQAIVALGTTPHGRFAPEGGFLDIAGDDHRSASDKVSRVRQDVCFDAQVHTLGSRPHLLASRPCTVQVNFLVYPGTSGAEWLDFIIADPAVLPAEAASRSFTEKVVYMPVVYQANYFPPSVLLAKHSGPVPGALASASPHSASARGAGQKERPFRFCNFNKMDKLEPTTFAVWARVLARVPGSVLQLLRPSTRLAVEEGQASSPSNGASQHLNRSIHVELAARGVQAGRIEWVPRLPKAAHFARHDQCDLFLDTVVYNAHTTCTDALFAGLPVLTLRGRAFASRVSASLVESAGLPELVVFSIKEYEAVAVWVATRPYGGERNLPLRAQLLREKLRRCTALSSPCGAHRSIFDSAFYARSLERAALAMWTIQTHSAESMHLALEADRKPLHSCALPATDGRAQRATETWPIEPPSRAPVARQHQRDLRGASAIQQPNATVAMEAVAKLLLLA